MWSAFTTSIMFTFLIGPLNVFLQINEGKLSLEKIKEDYEDERMDFYQMARDQKDRNNDILPTHNKQGPRKRTTTQTAPQETSEFN